MIRKMLSKDEEFVKFMQETVKANDGYCPCSIERSPDTLCMCKEFRDSDKIGLCHCGLYENVEVDQV